MTTPAISSPFSYRDRYANQFRIMTKWITRTDRKIRRAYRKFVRKFQVYSTFGFWAIVIGWILFS